MSTVETKPRKKTSVPAFGVEIDHYRNADIVLQSIPGCRMRTAWSMTKTVTNVKNGKVGIPKSQMNSGMPNIPGMQIHVNPADCTYTITDPLEGNDDLCSKISHALREKGLNVGRTDVKGCPPQKGTLDVHRMKTLCRELLTIIDCGDAKICKGMKPDLDDIAELNGHFLLNPGSRIQNGQPEFEKDWNKWRERLTAQGG